MNNQLSSNTLQVVYYYETKIKIRLAKIYATYFKCIMAVVILLFILTFPWSMRHYQECSSFVQTPEAQAPVEDESQGMAACLQ